MQLVEGNSGQVHLRLTSAWEQLQMCCLLIVLFEVRATLQAKSVHRDFDLSEPAVPICPPLAVLTVLITPADIARYGLSVSASDKRRCHLAQPKDVVKGPMFRGSVTLHSATRAVTNSGFRSQSFNNQNV